MALQKTVVEIKALETLIPGQVIPHGWYCYTVLSAEEDGRLRTRRCPYWDTDPERDPMETGYCHYMKAGDADEGGLSMLWDQVKECTLNLGEDDIEDNAA